MSAIFNTDKRIKLGIWGLGRGMSFFNTCRALHLDVVAGCDLNEDMCRTFQAHNPGAYVTTSAEEFLAQDFDAVLLATYAIGHADHAIQCLKAGKHVLSEVISFFTLEEGVRLVEAVEESGLVYQLAENYPFSPTNNYLARKWKEGLFGDLMYAEYGYVHECRSLCYTYIDGKPVQPGNEVHNWRSWMNYHYYCTHSLGPVMVITGTRPTRVTTLPCKNSLAGYVKGKQDGMGGVAPSLIQMSGGGLVRNLMGATTDDGSTQRLMGTRGAAEINKGLWLRLGGGGGSPKYQVTPSPSELEQQAMGTGHGGGDFWVLYYFAREILTGEKGPFDVYSAADVTMPGILAYRSAMEDGKAFDVPDFRQKSERDKHRTDDWQQERYDTKSVFPVNADFSITKDFSDVMMHLCGYAQLVRAFVDWTKVEQDMSDPSVLQLKVAEPLLADFDNVVHQYKRGRSIADAYPESDGARVICELLELGEEERVLDGTLRSEVESVCARMREENGVSNTFITPFRLSPLQEKTCPLDEMPLPGNSITFGEPIVPLMSMLDLRDYHEKKDGILYARATYTATKEGAGKLHFGSDGALKIWVNGTYAICETKPNGRNRPSSCEVEWKAGENEILLAVDSQHGQAVALALRAEEATQKK